MRPWYKKTSGKEKVEGENFSWPQIPYLISSHTQTHTYIHIYVYLKTVWELERK